MAVIKEKLLWISMLPSARGLESNVGDKSVGKDGAGGFPTTFPFSHCG